MGRTVAIGIQDFEQVIDGDVFYIDKTDFIREWWESMDSVTLITRPRRFGKTLNMSMLNRFFSNKYAKKGSIFEGLSIWEDEKYRTLQGTYPVINLTFANVKETDFEATRFRIYEILKALFEEFSFLQSSEKLSEAERAYCKKMTVEIEPWEAPTALHQLSRFLYQHYGKKVLILLDEYDTPMQEAYVNGFWDELAAFTRSMFHSTFKTNPCLERAIMTGITRVGKESVFSDLNNLEINTTTSDKYATAFGFTECEVFAGLEECGLGEEKAGVKRWYDGFTFGTHRDIYNPWSIINFLKAGKYNTYWANTSANSLVGKLIREGNNDIKEQFEQLIKGGSLRVPVDEQIVYNQLEESEEAVWSLLLASGYLKVLSFEEYQNAICGQKPEYEMALTNYEVTQMFQEMVSGWFARRRSDYNRFINAMLSGDTEAMNAYMNRVALHTFSYFDTGKNPSGEGTERFYHGFVLGLIVDLQGRYIITSNRESGFGRYDVVLEPKNPKEDIAVILEFKVFHPEKEKTLEDTVKAALKQIEQKNYAAALLERGVLAERIFKYGFAFEGKHVLIDSF